LGHREAIHSLVEFGRLVSAAGAPEEILEHLVAGMIDLVAVDGIAVVRVRQDDGVELVASRGLPDAVRTLRVEVDTIDAELGRQVLAAAGVSFGWSHVIPLVSGRDLYGAVVLFCNVEVGIREGQLELAHGFADLTAIALAQAARYDELARSYQELRDSREVMARSEKLRALGQMAAGVSHDLRNILNPLSLQLEVMQRKLSRQDSAGALDAMGRMRETLRYGLETVERLRAFSRQLPEPENEPTDLDRTAQLAVELSRARLGQHPKVSLHEQLAAPPAIHGRPSELVTSLVNLILNATEAMGDEGGSITIRTGITDGGSFVEVEDTGPGIPPEVERQVFDPFFTTKKEGTGLGLAMVYASAERQRGRVELDTAPGRGTRVRLWFPAAPASDPNSAPSE
jgi:signal transduction histidine kinase